MFNSFKIVAIRAPKIPEELTGAAKRQARLIQKRVGEDNTWYYFYDDYADINIEEFGAGGGYIAYTRTPKKYRQLYDLENINVEVCAIVGKNGTGKSSLVDLLIRTINNISATVIGELYAYPAAEHLHFIENVYSDLCIKLDNQFYVFQLRGRDVQMMSYKRAQGNIFLYDDTTPLLDGRSDAREPITPRNKAVLEKFFYTLVCNYSLYGFNYRDYIEEQTPKIRLQKIYDALTKEEKEERGLSYTDNPEDAVWLKGLFYKNDGYQTPLVIHPMRIAGSINVIRENELSKERLMKIFFYQNSKGEYPLRTINGNLKVNAVSLRLRDEEFRDSDALIRKLKLTARQNLTKSFEQIGDYIFNYWIERYEIKDRVGRVVNADSQAIKNYIIYKTIKIANTYPQFRRLKALLRATNVDYEAIGSALNTMYIDRSAKTRKLRRAIHYIATDIYNDRFGVYPIESLTNKIRNIVGDGDIDPYLPPSIYDVEFLLQKGDCNDIQFAHLSSGEKQIAYTIGSFLYHVSNVDSAWKAKNANIVRYKYMNVIFDEVEQYYHPELQRCFLSYLLQGLSCMDFKGLKGINIMMVTHSPFVLSDIPRDNVLVMKDKPADAVGPETFCGNINDLLDSPFFMDYSIGEVARQKVNDIISLYDTVVVNHQEQPEDVKVRLYYARNVVRRVGDAYIKKSLEQMLRELERQIE